MWRYITLLTEDSDDTERKINIHVDSGWELFTVLPAAGGIKFYMIVMRMKVDEADVVVKPIKKRRSA
jgi:hypothetical protein